MRLKKLKRERAVDAVYHALREAILGSLMHPGERLCAQDLAGKLGVSMTPVRHALQWLATEGLVQVKPRSGTFVASLDGRDLEETFEIRRALECLAGERAVERVTAEHIQGLKQRLKALRKAVRSEEDRRNHERENSEFHRLIIEISGNRRLAEMYDALNAHIKIARLHRREPDWPSRLARERVEHERIVASLAARDGDALVKTLREHIDRAREALGGGIGPREAR